MGAARAGAWSPSPPRSIRPGRSRAHVRDAAIMLRSMAGHDAEGLDLLDAPVPDYEAAVGRSVKGLTIGIPKEYRLDGMNRRDRGAVGEGADWLQGGGREDRRREPAAHAPRAAGLLHRRAGGGVDQSRALRRRALRPARARRRHRRPVREDARARLRPGSAAAPDDRHLRALGRLLRRLLRARAEDPHADQARLRDRVRRRRRRHPDAGDAVGRFRHRREGLGRSRSRCISTTSSP